MLQILLTEPVALVKNPNTMKIDPLQFNNSSGKHFLAVFIHLPTYKVNIEVYFENSMSLLKKIKLYCLYFAAKMSYCKYLPSTSKYGSLSRAWSSLVEGNEEPCAVRPNGGIKNRPIFPKVAQILQK